MALIIRTERLTDEDRRLLAEQDAERWCSSPTVPFLVGAAGLAGIAWAFQVWPRSMEGAAALVFFGASAMAAGWWVAHERWAMRRWQDKLRRDREKEIARGEVIAVWIDCERVVPMECFEDLYTAIFLASPQEYLLVTDAILLHLPRIDKGSYPRELSFRLLPRGAVISATAGTEDASIGPELTDDQRARIFGSVEMELAAEMPFVRIPATTLHP